MSRSYKKHPISKDNTKSSHECKKKASRRWRRAPESVKTKSKWNKHTNSWDIHDYIYRYTRQDAIKAWYDEETDHEMHPYLHKKYGTLENYLNRNWKKYYVRK